MKKKTYELKFHGRKLVVEVGELAKQADGAVLVRYNDTVILTAAWRKLLSNSIIYHKGTVIRSTVYDALCT